MPYTLTWEPQGVIKTFSGFVSGDEFIKSVEEILVDDRFNDLYFIINDFLAVDGHGIDEKTVKWLSSVRVGSHAFNSNLRITVVTQSGEVASTAKKIGPTQYGGAYETRAFESVRQAKEWSLEPRE